MVRQQDAIARRFNKASTEFFQIVIGQGRAGSMTNCKAKQLQEGTAGQGRAGHDRAGHGRRGHGGRGHGRAGQGRAGQGRAQQVHTTKHD